MKLCALPSTPESCARRQVVALTWINGGREHQLTLPSEELMTEQSLLLTDLYELSMLEAYAAHGMAETAVFELFVRKLPPGAAS